MKIILKWIFKKWDGDTWTPDLAQDRVRWRESVNAVKNLRVAQNAGNFLTDWGPVSFSGMTLFDGISCTGHIAHFRQQSHNSKSVIFRERILKVLKCYTFLWVQRRHNCSPAASFANCVTTLYLLKVYLKTFLSVPITQKWQILSCDTLVANEWHVSISLYLITVQLYVCTYVYIYVCVCVYISIYVYRVTCHTARNIDDF